MARVLLLLPTTTYKIPDFLCAAERLRVDFTVAAEEPSTLEKLNPAGLLTLDFQDPEGSALKAAEFAKAYPIDAVIAVDEDTAVVGAAIAQRLGLPHNPPEAAAAARHKGLMRERLARAGVPSPRHWLFRLDEDSASAAVQIPYPCVLKPTFLAASRGVIRANGPDEFRAAWSRIERILREPEVARRSGEAAKEMLAEEFVPGVEAALEGLLRKGTLEILAIFDKPDPLEGPFFEETVYVTPSRLSQVAQEQIADVASRGCAALGLVDGPVHAELRWNEHGAVLIELAARSIGGLCSRTLKFGFGMSLEELLLRHALGTDSGPIRRDPRAAAVMMIPVPAEGVLREVRGLEEAGAVPDVEEVTITVHPGQRLVPWPEGSRYPGFIFSRAGSPERAEAAVREAHGKLRFVMEGEANS